MIGALTYEEVLRATMRSNWIHALWLFAVVVLIWVCTILLTLHNNRKKKPKGKDDSWQVSAKKRHALACRFTRRSLNKARIVPAAILFTNVMARMGRAREGMGFPSRISIFAAGASKKKHQPVGWCFFLEAPPGFEPGVKDLQSHALPLGYGAKKWSGQRDSNSLPPPWQGGALPNELCPQMVPQARIELATRGFSVRCSTY